MNMLTRNYGKFLAQLEIGVLILFSNKTTFYMGFLKKFNVIKRSTIVYERSFTFQSVRNTS